MTIDRFRYIKIQRDSEALKTINAMNKHGDSISFVVSSTGPGKRGHIVADTLLPTQMFPACATFVADTNFVSGTQKIILMLFPVCAAQETSWATMCPQQCVLVCQGLNLTSKLNFNMSKTLFLQISTEKCRTSYLHFDLK